MKIMRNKTFIQEVVRHGNAMREEHTYRFLQMLHVLLQEINHMNSDPKLNIQERLIDYMNTQINHYIHNLKMSTSIQVNYQSRRALNKELKQTWTRKGRKFIKRHDMGKISPAEFRQKLEILEQEGALYKRSMFRKKREKNKVFVMMHEKLEKLNARISILEEVLVVFTKHSQESTRNWINLKLDWLKNKKNDLMTRRAALNTKRTILYLKPKRSEGTNFVDLSVGSSGNEKFTNKTIHKTTKTSMEGK